MFLFCKPQSRCGFQQKRMNSTASLSTCSWNTTSAKCQAVCSPMHCPKCSVKPVKQMHLKLPREFSHSPSHFPSSHSSWSAHTTQTCLYCQGLHTQHRHAYIVKVCTQNTDMLVLSRSTHTTQTCLYCQGPVSYTHLRAHETA